MAHTYKRFLYLAGFQALLFVVFILMMIFRYGFNLLTSAVLVTLVIGIVMNLILYIYFKKVVDYQEHDEQNSLSEAK